MSPAWDREALRAAPMFAALHALLDDYPDIPALAALNVAAAARGIVSGGGAPLRFVPPGDADLYEAAIYRCGAVATRLDNWHDLFNALAWLAFPRAKAALNRAHCEEVAARGAAAPRGRRRDALTLFDESGLVMLTAGGDLAALLRDHRWQELFIERRAEVLRHARFLIFGHALHEKALAPFSGITGKTLVVAVDDELLCAPLALQLDHADAACAEWAACPQPLAPLPILGIPGWWPANEHPGYYDDDTHFRPLAQALDAAYKKGRPRRSGGGRGVRE